MKKFSSKKILAGSSVLFTAPSLIGAQSAVNSNAISFNLYDWWLGLVSCYSNLMVYIWGRQWLVSKIEDAIKEDFNIKKIAGGDDLCYAIASLGENRYSFLVKVKPNDGGSGFEVLSGKESLCKCDSMNDKSLYDLGEALTAKFYACDKDAEDKAVLKVKEKISEKFKDVTFADHFNSSSECCEYVVTFNFSDRIRVFLPFKLQFKDNSHLFDVEKLEVAKPMKVFPINFSSNFDSNGYSLDDEDLGRMVKDLGNWHDAVCSDIKKLEELVEKYQFGDSNFFEGGGNRGLKFLVFPLKKGLSVKISDKKKKEDFLLGGLVYDIEKRKIFAIKLSKDLNANTVNEYAEDYHSPSVTSDKEEAKEFKRFFIVGRKDVEKELERSLVELFFLENEDESKEFETFLSNLKTEIEKKGSFTPLAPDEKKEISVDIWQSELSS